MTIPLPPVAWLREREWGRHVTSYARGQYDRIPDWDFICESACDDDVTATSVIVNFGLYRIGDVHITGISDEQAQMIARVSGHEVETAEMMVPFVADGAQYHALGRDLVARTLEGPPPTIGSVMGRTMAFYVRCEGLALEGPYGNPLDGFLIRRVAADEHGPGSLDILAMEQTLPGLDEVLNPTPYLCLDLEDAARGLEDAIAEEASTLLAYASEYQNRFGDDDTPPEEYELKPEDSRTERRDKHAKRFDAVVRRGYRTIRGSQAERMTSLSEWMTRNAPASARLLAMACLCIDGRGLEGKAAYPEGANAGDVAKALATGTGARKAAQRLTAVGHPRMTRYDLVRASEALPSMDHVTEAEPTDAQVQQDGRSESVVHAEGEARTVVRNRDRRKQKRLMNRVRDVAAAAPAPAIPHEDADAQKHAPGTVRPPESAGDKIETAAPDQRAEAEWLDDAVPGAPIPLGRNEDLARDVDDTLRRLLRDLPPLTGRNWEASFPSALAAMLMRRLKVDRNPRETDDATRKRLAADILPRLRGLPEHLARLRAEEAANPARRRFARISPPLAPRQVDRYVADQAVHPITVVVHADQALAALIRFPGTDASDRPQGEPLLIVRAWLDVGTLRLDGILFEGCLAGFRRIEHDLSTGDTRTFDGDADGDDAQDVLDALYAPLADAVLGPIDEADVWRHQRSGRKPRRHSEIRPEPACAAPAADSIPCTVVAEQAPHVPALAKPTGLTVRPDDREFHDWRSVSAPWTTPPMDATLAAEARARFSSSTIVCTILDALSAHAANPEGDSGIAAVLHAAGRHASSFADSEGSRILAMSRPEITEDVDLSDLEDGDGILVINDPALTEQLGPGLIPGRRVSRERAIAVMFRLRRDGVAALVLQITAETRIAYAEWIHTPLHRAPDVDDATWYVRGAIHEALAPRLTLTGDDSGQDRLVALPRQTGAGDSRRQGPRRVVAQARIRPERMSVAIGVIRRWFDDQARRHGERLVEDRREDGEWTHEHSDAPAGGVAAHWAVTVRMPQDNPGAIDVILRTTLATGVRPRLPNLVREIAMATPTEGPDGRLLVETPVVRSRGDLLELIRHLQSPDRVLPTLVMTATRDGEFLKPPTDVALQSLGAMNVRVLTDEMTYEMADALGQEYRTFGGAARLFQPRFDPDVDPASRHPRIMPDVAGGRAINDMIGRVTAVTVTRYDIPEVAVAQTAAVEPAGRIQAAQSDRMPTPDVESKPHPTTEEDDRQLPLSLDATNVGRGGDDQAFDGGDAAPAREETAPASDVPVEQDHGPEDGSSGPGEFQDGEENTPEADAGVDQADDASTISTPRPVRPEPQGAVPAASAPTTKEDISDIVERAVGRTLQALGMEGIAERMAQVAATVERMAAAVERRIDDGVGHAAVLEREARIVELQDELRAERETMSQLLEEAAGDRDAAISETARLRQALNQRRRADAVVQEEWPRELSGLSEWLDRNVLPNVVITSKAWRAMRHVRYTDMERLCRTLQLLDGAYVDMRAGEEGAKQRWDDGLKELRLENKKQSEMGKSVRGGHEYSFTHEGSSWTMDFHIRGTESLFNNTERLLRIYFAFDKEQGRVLIGHLPTHLTTVDS